MTIKQAIAYIHSTSWLGSQLGLFRMVELLEQLGNPEKQLKFIHVAGTNGKGSTCVMLSSILTAAGYKTGLYTSPYIQRFNERIQIDGTSISDEDLIAVTQQVKVHADEMTDPPTEFELVTVIGLLHFAQQGCDLVVLEVGLGGRLDATNVIPVPEVAVITPIGLDHTAELGGTLEKIAAEKAGIIKPAGWVILAPQEPEVEQVIVSTCMDRQAVLKQVDICDAVPESSDLDGQWFTYQNELRLHLPLLGAHQLQNAATALKTTTCLREAGWLIPDSAIAAGLEAVRWPGRFELLHKHPTVIVDGAHNPQGVQTLVDALSAYFPDKKITFVMGVMADKDYRSMIALTAPLAERYITVMPSNTRVLDSYELSVAIQESCDKVTLCGHPLQGLRTALEQVSDEEVVCVFGSLYMIGEIRNYFG